MTDSALDTQAQWYVERGWRIESRVGDAVSMVKGRPINHLLHLILTLLTLGLWGLFVWLPLCIFGGEKRRVIHSGDLALYNYG